MFDNKITLYCGDSQAILKTLPDESINCCITSPPYWGLRDYGTSKWEGGDINCDHIEFATNYNKDFNKRWGNGDGAFPQKQEVKSFLHYKDICGKCGAKRVDSQLGLEKTPEEYTLHMVDLFREIRRVLKNDGTLWLNLGDSYNGSGGDHKVGGKNDAGFQGNLYRGVQPKFVNNLKPKDLVGIPWMVAFALRADGWWLRQDLIWHKPNPMPESVTDRCTKAHEYIFLLSKSSKYYFDNYSIKEPLNFPKETRRPLGSKGAWKIDGRQQGDNGGGKTYKGYPTMKNKRSVWSVTVKPFKGSHFATFPEDLIKPCVLAGCPEGGIIIDPFAGAGTTGVVALKNNRKFVGLELNQKYIDEIIIPRLKLVTEKESSNGLV
jgi:DNA modification methylase